MKQIKRWIVLVLLLILPICLYILLSTGIHNFTLLPLIDSEVHKIDINSDKINLKNHISILCFFGSNMEIKKNNILNLNQKVYKTFEKFEGFQIVVLVDENEQSKVNEIKEEISKLNSMDNWKFVFLKKNQIFEYFNFLNIEEGELNENAFTPNVYFIDKDLNLRGRNDSVVGYNTNTVADVNFELLDDLKILIAEYRRKESQKRKSIIKNVE